MANKYFYREILYKTAVSFSGLPFFILTITPQYQTKKILLLPYKEHCID